MECIYHLTAEPPVIVPFLHLSLVVLPHNHQSPCGKHAPQVPFQSFHTHFKLMPSSFGLAHPGEKKVFYAPYNSSHPVPTKFFNLFSILSIVTQHPNFSIQCPVQRKQTFQTPSPLPCLPVVSLYAYYA